MHIKQKSFIDMINLIARNVLGCLGVIILAVFLGISENEAFIASLGIWMVIQPIRLILYVYQLISREKYSLYLEATMISYKYRNYYINGDDVVLKKMKGFPWYKIEITYPSGGKDIIHLGIVSRSNVYKIETEMSQYMQHTQTPIHNKNEWTHQAFTSQDEKVQTVNRNKNLLRSQNHTIIVDDKLQKVVHVETIDLTEGNEELESEGLKWGQETIEGNLEGFALNGVVYDGFKLDSMSILQTHCTKSISKGLILEIEKPHGVIDIRVNGTTLDFLVETYNSERTVIEDYLIEVFKHLKQEGIGYQQRPSTLIRQSSNTFLQQFLYIILVGVVSFIVYGLLSYLTFYIQLGRYIGKVDEIFIPNYTFILPFVAPFIMMLTMKWMSSKLKIAENVQSIKGKILCRLLMVVWILIVMVLVNCGSIIHQGNLIFSANIPYTRDGLVLILDSLKMTDFIDVYTIGIVLGGVSWGVILLAFLMYLREDLANSETVSTK